MTAPEPSPTRVRLAVTDIDADLRATYRYMRQTWGLDRHTTNLLCVGIAIERQTLRRRATVRVIREAAP